jgi:glycine cleavage system regulatory protein
VTSVSYAAWVVSLILTVIGDDRPGLVSAVSAPVEAHGGSWEQSQLSRLGGKFAGIVLVSVPEKEVEELVRELTTLDGLQVLAERTAEPESRQTLRFQLELLGDDHPGIVAEISASLAESHVSIEELTTDVREAPMSGGTFFEARAVLVAPPSTDTESLREQLEAIAKDLMVDVRLSDD